MIEKYPRATSYHEAGHAGVAWSLGLQVGTIPMLKKKTRAAALTSNLPTTSLSSIKLQSALPDMLRNAPLGSRITI